MTAKEDIRSVQMASSTILAVIPPYTLYTDSITFILGFVGNVLNLLVFLHLKCFRDQRITYYLTVEIIASLINRILSIAFNVCTIVYKKDLVANSIIWCRFRNIVLQVTGLVAFSMMCLTAMDQFCSTNYRLRLGQLCTFRLARCTTLILIGFWVLHSLLFAFYLHVQPPLGCVIWNNVWTQYATYFFYPGPVTLLPVVVASLFGLLAYQNVRRIIRRQIPIARRRFDRQITAMVLIRVIFFALLVTPFGCYRIYAINTTYDRGSVLEAAISRLVLAVVNTLLYIHYGISFYLYIWISARYRRQVKYVLKKKIWQRCSKWCGMKENRITPDADATVSTGSNLELQ